MQSPDRSPESGAWNGQVASGPSDLTPKALSPKRENKETPQVPPCVPHGHPIGAYHPLLCLPLRPAYCPPEAILVWR